MRLFPFKDCILYWQLLTQSLRFQFTWIFMWFFFISVKFIRYGFVTLPWFYFRNFYFFDRIFDLLGWFLVFFKFSTPPIECRLFAFRSFISLKHNPYWKFTPIASFWLFLIFIATVHMKIIFFIVFELFLHSTFDLIF